MTAVCPSCGGPSTDPHGPLHATCPAPDPEAALLARPGVMRATWWSHCRGCDAVIHGPGSADLPCPCGTRHALGDVVGLADLPSGRAWVCRDCLTAAEVPEPRDPYTTRRALEPVDPHPNDVRSLR